ncbi:MAG: hypothetical protein KDC61_11965, partial [Saprospiraceae bacterium]|nr:hypothetical protein [Saprospiraceae bacterium]
IGKAIQIKNDRLKRLLKDTLKHSCRSIIFIGRSCACYCMDFCRISTIMFSAVKCFRILLNPKKKALNISQWAIIDKKSPGSCQSRNFVCQIAPFAKR